MGAVREAVCSWDDQRHQQPAGLKPHTQPPSTHDGAPQQVPGSPQQMSGAQPDVATNGASQRHCPFTHVGARNASEPQVSVQENVCGAPSQVQNAPCSHAHAPAVQVAELIRTPLSQQSGPTGTPPHASVRPASTAGGAVLASGKKTASVQSGHGALGEAPSKPLAPQAATSAAHVRRIHRMSAG